jgi:hypothetical protein
MVAALTQLRALCLAQGCARPLSCLPLRSMAVLRATWRRPGTNRGCGHEACDVRGAGAWMGRGGSGECRLVLIGRLLRIHCSGDSMRRQPGQVHSGP